MNRKPPDIRVLRTSEEFADLRLAWNGLLETVDGHTFLQSYDFLSCWWRSFGRDRELRLICAFDGERLIGAAALQRVEKRLAGRTTGVLEFAGMPDDILRPTLLVSGRDVSVLRALLSGIDSLTADWQVMQLEEVQSGAWFIDELRHWAAQRRLRLRLQALHACPYLAKNGVWADFLRSRSKRFAKRLRQTGNKLARCGKVGYLQMSEAGESERFVNAFLAVEKKSWKAERDFAVGDDRRYATFYTELLKCRGSAARGHALILTIDDTPIAATLGISWQGVYYALQIAHDRSYDRYSPGFLLEAREMAWFFDHAGLRRYEFLGGEVFSKRLWTETAVAASLISVYRPVPRLILYMFVKRTCLPAIKRFLNRAKRHRATTIEPFRAD